MDPDLPLIQALQAGDDSALNELIHRHREALFHFVYRYLRDETVARDIVQETFVRAYFKAGRFKPQALVKTWLYAIALNLARDEARKHSKRHRQIPLENAGEDAPIHEIPDTEAGPGARADQADEFARLHDAISRLPGKLRDALILFSIEGKSQKEAADILATSSKTVELRVYHAKRKLREWLRLG